MGRALPGAVQKPGQLVAQPAALMWQHDPQGLRFGMAPSLARPQSTFRIQAFNHRQLVLLPHLQLYCVDPLRYPKHQT